MEKEIITQVQETQRVQNRINPRQNTPRHILIKLTKIKEQILKAAREKQQITHKGPDILECEVKWALGSITMNKPSGGDGIPVELFQILKDNAVKVLHSICQQIWKTQQWPQDWKRSVFILIPKKGNAKECSNCHTIAFISHVAQRLKHLPGMWETRV